MKKKMNIRLTQVKSNYNVNQILERFLKTKSNKNLNETFTDSSFLTVHSKLLIVTDYSSKIKELCINST